jgi:hypothetical protein
MAQPQHQPTSRFAASDVALGLGMGVLLAAFLVAHHQRQLWGDGWGLFALTEWAARPWWHVHYHPGYTWAVDVCRALGPFDVGLGNALLASSLPTAGACACTFWLARRVGCERLTAFLVTALVATTPTALFFGTLLEVHALHQGAAAVALLVTREAALRVGPRVFAWIAHGAFAALALTHATAFVLVPGFVVWLHVVGRNGALAGLGRRAVLAFHLRQVVVAGLLVAASIAAFELASRALSTGTGAGYMLEIFVDHMQPWDFGFLVDEWIAPLGGTFVALAVAALALVLPHLRLRRRAGRTRLLLAFPGPVFARLDGSARTVALATAAWCVAPFLFFNWWNVRDNEGGYLAPLLPALALFMGAATRAAPPGRTHRAVVALLSVALVAQLVLGARQLDDLERADLARRPPVADVALELLPSGGFLVTGRVPRWDLRTEAPGWTTFEFERLVEVDPSGRFVHDLDDLLARELHIEGRPVVVDLTYRRRLMQPESPLFERLSRFEQHLVRSHELRIVDDPRCSVALLTPRAPTPSAP